MPVFKDPDALRRHLADALGEQLRLVVVETQSELGSAAVSPVDTGRFRSSWFASLGTPSSEVAPVGTDSPSTDAKGLRVTARDTVHLTNSLPYAEAVAIEGRVVAKPQSWFKSFRESRMPAIVNAAGGFVQKKYDL